MEDLESRGAPIEYWFFKFNSGSLAFLVDFIVRRRHHQAEVRLSLWVRGTGRVERAYSASWRTNSTTVAIASCELGSGASRGAVADVEWQLGYQAGSARIDPAPLALKLLRPLDMQLLSRPQARFQGSVRVGQEQFAISDASGLLCHYWGARLPARWCWVSASNLGGRPGRWRRSCCAPGCGDCPAPIGHRLLVRDPGRSDPHARLAAHRPHALTRELA